MVNNLAQERINSLIQEFGACLTEFERQKIFTGPSVYFHNKTLENCSEGSASYESEVKSSWSPKDRRNTCCPDPSSCPGAKQSRAQNIYAERHKRIPTTKSKRMAERVYSHFPRNARRSPRWGSTTSRARLSRCILPGRPRPLSIDGKD